MRVFENARAGLLAFVVASAATSTRGAGLPAAGADLDSVESRSYPVCSAVVDVTKAPYFARGDGATDCTDALQEALSETMGRRKILYLPEGVYLVSRTLEWSKKNADGRDAWGFNAVQGRHPRRSVIRLKDAVFTDASAPKAVMWCGGFGSADWFHNYVQGVTIDVGRGNPGAIGLQFYSNNTGAVRDVAIVSGDGRGAVGLDLGHRDMNGPLLVRNVEVRGFDVGIRTGAVVNSQTFEHLRLSGQREVGFANFGQAVAIRGLASDNAVVALRTEGFTAILESELIGRGVAGGAPAVQVGKAPFFARDVATRGYKAALAAEGGGAAPAGENLAEYCSGGPTNPFGSSSASLRLPVRETPDVPYGDPAGWAVVDAFGADPTGDADSSAAIQKAIDSGTETVFFPGSYDIRSPVRVRGKVRRLLGVGNWLDYNKHSAPDLIIADGDAPVVVMEHFASVNGGVAVETDRSVVFRSVQDAFIAPVAAGDLFLEDVATADLRHSPGQNVWARQLDIENQGTHLTNAGGKLWVLGYKTERGGCLVRTSNGGATEIFGNFSYTTTAGSLAPMFVTEDASVFAFFNEVCFSGDPFRTLIRERRGDATRIVRRGEGSLAPYVANPAARRDGR
ncbi:glycosyl hydrolase family 28-related protein [Paludisphaera mucosa]|uniref:Glycosyl hydrolase family 28-related protein n=1 Tax=Paludisphaera mucosa TaxID=3030827 RepID=A0ABT6FIH2_9BACT|nr:glycosyl hydrolase family 28-related protein [Paludisphaera mucosa]MDG3007371.1 glycosyl hydrolase family 28-related protein [Paludisphaera mucosa]